MYHRQKFKRVQISKDVTLKSGLEEVVYHYLTNANCTFKYESLKVTYFQPEVKKTYRPDFPIKGSFNSADRKKMKLVKKQNPKLDIRFIFSNAKTKIGKKSLTTYGKWCELNDFPYHCIYSTQQTFPKEWLKEIKEKQNGKTRN
jgi:hypothetical protein